MGLYDIFHGKCPFCDTDYAGQTKFFDCEMLHLDPGDPISAFNYGDMRLEMKERCLKCNKHPIAVIKDSIFVGFEKDKPTEREGYFGELLHDGEDRREVYDEMIKDAIREDK